jgi:hypothetical protein
MIDAAAFRDGLLEMATDDVSLALCIASSGCSLSCANR